MQRLLRFHWVERRLMSILVAHLTAEPVWEVKCAIALHQWQSAQHVDALRARIAEMRNPAPRLDGPPANDPTAAALDAFLGELLRSRDTVELIAGIHGMAYPALAAAYREHLAHTNPLIDQPTRRLMRVALAETEEAIAWGERALPAAVAGAPDPATAERAAAAWQDHLLALLRRAQGIAGDVEQAASVSPPPSSREPDPETRSPTTDFHPRRDARFTGRYNFEFPPHVVYNMDDVPADERNLALLCKRTLEMDVPEMMASFMTERGGEAWEFYRDYSRQLWDEARHAMMGSVAFEARGVNWKGEIPLNISFALRLNLHASPVERQMMLYAIEQSLMPGETGKRYERDTAAAAGDALSAHFHDYDWADEVLHAQIGRRMLKREGISSEEAQELAREVHEKTWAALARYRHLDPQTDWWPDFVQRVLGRPSAAAEAERPELNIFSE